MRVRLRGASLASTVRSLRPQLPVLVGLGLAAGLGACLVLRPATPGPDAVERGAPGGSPASTLRSLSPDHQGRGALWLLRWTPYPGARSCNVTGDTTPDLAVVHQAVGVSEQELRLPQGRVGADAAAHELLMERRRGAARRANGGLPTFRVEVSRAAGPVLRPGRREHSEAAETERIGRRSDQDTPARALVRARRRSVPGSWLWPE